MTLRITTKAHALQKAGKDVLIFAAGEPDTPTPDVVVESAIAALRAGDTRYKPALGDTPTREAIAHKLTVQNKLPGLTRDHIAVTAGAKQALYNVCQCLFDPPRSGQPAQEAIIPVPSWVSYRPIVELAGGSVVPLYCSPDRGFKPRPEDFRSLVNERTRVVFLNSPNNPTGAVLSPSEVRAVADELARLASTVAPDLVVISDEIYENIIFDGVQHCSPGSVPSLAERTITINGLSKSASMTGWRAGYAACPGAFGAELIQATGKFQEQSLGNITSFVMPAMCAALTQIEDHITRMRASFEERSRLIYEGLNSIEGVHCSPIGGAFYAFPDISAHLGKTTPLGVKVANSTIFAEALLDEAGIAVVQGAAFEGCGDRHLRFSFAKKTEVLHAGVDRFRSFCASLS